MEHHVLLLHISAVSEGWDQPSGFFSNHLAEPFSLTLPINQLDGNESHITCPEGCLWVRNLCFSLVSICQEQETSWQVKSWDFICYWMLCHPKQVLAQTERHPADVCLSFETCKEKSKVWRGWGNWTCRYANGAPTHWPPEFQIHEDSSQPGTVNIHPSHSFLAYMLKEPETHIKKCK